MNLGVSFAPLVPSYVVWTAFAVAALISVILLIARSRGAPLRASRIAQCVARSPSSRERATAVNRETHCSDDDCTSKDASRNRSRIRAA